MFLINFKYKPLSDIFTCKYLPSHYTIFSFCWWNLIQLYLWLLLGVSYCHFLNCLFLVLFVFDSISLLLSSSLSLSHCGLMIFFSFVISSFLFSCIYYRFLVTMRLIYHHIHIWCWSWQSLKFEYSLKAPFYSPIFRFLFLT